MFNINDAQKWRPVQNALKSKSNYSLQIAIIKADNIFLRLLKDKHIKAEDSEKAFAQIRGFLSAPEQLKAVVKLYQNIVRGQEVSLDYGQTKKYITAYYQALLDVKDENSLKFTVVNKGVKEFARILKLLVKKIQYFVIGFFGFLILVVFLSETKPGQALVQGVVNLAKLLLFSFLPALFIAVAVIILVVGSIVYYTKRNKPLEGEFIIEEEDEDENEDE